MPSLLYRPLGFLSFLFLHLVQRYVPGESLRSRPTPGSIEWRHVDAEAGAGGVNIWAIRREIWLTWGECKVPPVMIISLWLRARYTGPPSVLENSIPHARKSPSFLTSRMRLARISLAITRFFRLSTLGVSKFILEKVPSSTLMNNFR